MDARERENSQSYRPSIKRPWEEETVPSQPPRWHGNTLPPINAPQHHKQSPRSRDNGSNLYHPYGIEVGGESAAKRMRQEGYMYGESANVPQRLGDYTMLSRENLDLNGRLLQAQDTRKSQMLQHLATSTRTNTFYSSDSSYAPHRNPPNPPSFSSFPRIITGERWDSQSGDREGAAALLHANANTPPLCRRCRRSIRPNFGVDKSCEDCKNDPELAHVVQNAALGLSQLAATLSSGVSSQQRIAIGIVVHEVSACGFMQSFCHPSIRQTASPTVCLASCPRPQRISADYKL